MEELLLHIDAYTPETIPMARLAEYLRDLAILLGEEKSVHLLGVDKGSLNIVHAIEPEAAPKVYARVEGVRRGQAPPEALRANRGINRKLQEDNGTASLLRRNLLLDQKHQQGAEIIRFPGRDLLQGNIFKAGQEDSIDGIVIKLGGRKDPVPVHVESEHEVYSCYASRSLAKEMAPHIFVTELRLHGEARWIRDTQGEWHLERFFIKHFEPLNPAPLPEIVARLRAVRGNEWPTFADPWKELDEISNGPDGGNVSDDGDF